MESSVWSYGCSREGEEKTGNNATTHKLIFPSHPLQRQELAVGRDRSKWNQHQIRRHFRSRQLTSSDRAAGSSQPCSLIAITTQNKTPTHSDITFDPKNHQFPQIEVTLF